MSLPTLWADVGFKPNPAQKRAIGHIAGPLYLPAGPGSGKTRVLLWRTVNLIVFHDVKPDEIFLATFTEKAALQLKEGLRGLLAVASRHTGQHYDLAGSYLPTRYLPSAGTKPGAFCSVANSTPRFSISTWGR